MIMRPECNNCNHYPVCKDELKNNLSGDCPYYEEIYCCPVCGKEWGKCLCLRKVNKENGN